MGNLPLIMNPIKMIATIGPSSRRPEVLKKLRDRGVDFFRINLSHTSEEEIEDRILDIKDYGVQVILDTEGRQVRSGNREDLFLEENTTVKLYSREIECTRSQMFLNPVEITRNLREEDLISIDFNSVLLRVLDVSTITEGYISCRVIIAGAIGGRKAVHIDSPTFLLPPFSKKDIKAIDLAKKYGIKHFTLSFMEHVDSVKEFRRKYPEALIYSKIESKEGLNNFLEIARESDGILIDRGDLSHDIPLEKISLVQKYIINKVRNLGKDVFETHYKSPSATPQRLHLLGTACVAQGTASAAQSAPSGTDLWARVRAFLMGNRWTKIEN